MDEFKVIDLAENAGETIENVAETAEVVKEAMDIASEATKVTTKNPWSVVLIVIAAIGLIASGGWVVFGIWWLIKFFKNKKAAASKIDELDDDFEDDDFIAETEPEN